jgi:hypothetical protein
VRSEPRGGRGNKGGGQRAETERENWGSVEGETGCRGRSGCTYMQTVVTKLRDQAGTEYLDSTSQYP